MSNAIIILRNEGSYLRLFNIKVSSLFSKIATLLQNIYAQNSYKLTLLPTEALDTRNCSEEGNLLSVKEDSISICLNKESCLSKGRSF